MTDPERLAALAELRVPFDRAQIGRMPRGGVQLDYVGHANTTARLLNVDPEWTWEPVAYDDHGLPALMYHDGKPVGLWIRLTVCGVTRLGYGSCAPGKADAVKELIGDAIRNAAMRFGVALDLWSKEELEMPSGMPVEGELVGEPGRSAAGGQSEPTPNQAGDLPAAQAPAPREGGTQAGSPQPAQATGEARQTQPAPSAAAPPLTQTDTPLTQHVRRAATRQREPDVPHPADTEHVDQDAQLALLEQELRARAADEPAYDQLRKNLSGWTLRRYGTGVFEQLTAGQLGELLAFVRKSIPVRQAS